jgi:hypothetical protein
MVADKIGTLARRKPSFFLIAAALMTLVVFLGFLPSFYGRFHFRETPLAGHLILHGVVMTAWQLLFLAQTILVAAGRTDVHRKLGVAGVGLAAAVLVVGVHATLSQPASLAGRGITLPFPVELLVIANLFGFGLFGGLVAAAIVMRRDTASHRRLIYWACIVTLGPALTTTRSFGEMLAPFFPSTFPPEVALGWIAWIALLSHDWRTARSFHPATIIGGMLVLFIQHALVDWLVVMGPVRDWAQSLG